MPVVVDDERLAAWNAAVPQPAGAQPPDTSLFALAAARSALTAPLLDPRSGVDLIRMSISDVDVDVVAPCAGTGTLVAHGAITSKSPHALGTAIVVNVVVDCGDVVVMRGAWTFLARAPRRREDPAELSRARADDEARFDALPQRRAVMVAVPDDAPRRFAAASLDDDPLHVDDDVAVMAGLPAPVLSLDGMLSVLAAAAEHAAGRRLQRLRLRPGHPVLGGDTLTIVVAGDGPTLALRALNQHHQIVAAGDVDFT
jgi:acyl dehydratase